VLPFETCDVNPLPSFEIVIRSACRCELRSRDHGWSHQFESVKGALDFLEGLEDARVTITHETGPHAMRLIAPRRDQPPRNETGQFLMRRVE
jgi:hypothetical protein